jgi:15-cis-phytoene desaturase
MAQNTAAAAAAAAAAARQQQEAAILGAGIVPMGHAGQIVAARLRDVGAVWPSQANEGQPIKLPRQTKVGPDEYKEFLALGHGEIFALDLNRWVEVKALAVQ